MSRSNKKIIIALGILFILLLLLVWYRFLKNPQIPLAIQPAGDSANPSVEGNGVPTKEQKIVSASSAPEALARSFVERWGSFSTESDFRNVEELYASMTDSMRSWAMSYVAKQRATLNNKVYYGVTTHALAMNIMKKESQDMRLKIGTQRDEVKGTQAPRIFYQDMEVALKQDEGVWKVDGVWWK